MERVASGPEHAGGKARVNGCRRIRIAKGAKDVRRSKHPDRSWANRWEVWSNDGISRARLSNDAKDYSRRSCWRSDVVGSCRRSRGHAGEVSGSRHSLRSCGTADPVRIWRTCQSHGARSAAFQPRLTADTASASFAISSRKELGGSAPHVSKTREAITLR